MLNLKVLLRKQKTHTVDKRKRIAVSFLIKEGGPWQNALNILINILKQQLNMHWKMVGNILKIKKVTYCYLANYL